MQQQQKLLTKCGSFFTLSSWTLNDAFDLFIFLLLIFGFIKFVKGGARRLKIKTRTTSKISCTWASWRFVFFMWLFFALCSICSLFASYCWGFNLSWAPRGRFTQSVCKCMQGNTLQISAKLLSIVQVWQPALKNSTPRCARISGFGWWCLFRFLLASHPIEI